MDEPTIIDLHGDLEGRYVIEEQRADGALVIRPERDPDDESIHDILARHGERLVPADELPDWFHELPTDGEG